MDKETLMMNNIDKKLFITKFISIAFLLILPLLIFYIFAKTGLSMAAQANDQQQQSLSTPTSDGSHSDPTTEPYQINHSPWYINTTKPGYNPYQNGKIQLTDVSTDVHIASSAWNFRQIDLTKEFDLFFVIFLGYDGNGADGIVFVLQNQGKRSLGDVGINLGYGWEITPSIGIEIDTYRNTTIGDPDDINGADHIAFDIDGTVSHLITDTYTTTNTVPISIPNIEDGKEHTFRVRWNPDTQELSFNLDNSIQGQKIIDLIGKFDGDTTIWYGFTGAGTTWYNNIQYFYETPISNISTFSQNDECFNASIQGSQEWQGDPINTLTGGYSYSADDITINTSSGPLTFQRTYNSLFESDPYADEPGALGPGWTHNWDISLSFVGNITPTREVLFKGRTANKYLFQNNGDGTFTAQPGVCARLVGPSPTPQTTAYTLYTGNQEVYQFDINGRLETWKNSSGNGLAFIYDDLLRLARIEDLADSSRYLSFTYNPQGQLTYVRDYLPEQRQVHFSYESLGNPAVTYLTGVTDVLGIDWTYSYVDPDLQPDTRMLLSVITDPLLHQVERTDYYSDGRARTQYNGLDEKIFSISYPMITGDDSYLRIYTDSLNTLHNSVYDIRGTIVSSENPSGSEFEKSYDYNYRPVVITDSLGNDSLLMWDRSGINLTRIVDAQGFTTTMEYDDLNNLTLLADPQGYTSTYAYSGTLLTQSTDALENTTIYTYTSAEGNAPAGLLQAIRDSLGNVTEYEYDSFGNRTAITDTLGNRTSYGYDQLGRLISTTIAVSSGEQRTDFNCYDDAGRVTRTVKNASVLDIQIVCSAEYLPGNNPEYDQINDFVYDPVGNLIATIDWYTQAGSVYSQTTRTYYDEANQPIATVNNLYPPSSYLDENIPWPDDLYPERNIRVDTFYEQGKPAATIEYAIEGSEVITRVARTYYDALGRPEITIRNLVGYDYHNPEPPTMYVRTSDENVTTKNVYDAGGNIIETIDNSDRVKHFCYDSLNRTWKTIQNPSVSDPCRSYTPSGYPDEDIIEYTYYDANGNIVATIDPAGTITRTYFDKLNRPWSTVRNRTVLDFDETEPPYPSSSSPLENVRVDTIYDAAGNAVVTKEYLLVGGEIVIKLTRTYFDGLNRPYLVVQNPQEPGWTVESENPPICNRDLTGYLPPINICTETIYDPSGNVIAVIDPAGKVTRTYFNSLNQTILTIGNLGTYQVENPEPPSDYTLSPDLYAPCEYVYDSSGRNIATVLWYENNGEVFSTTTRTYYDPLGRVSYVVNNLTGWGITEPNPPPEDLRTGTNNITTHYIYDYSGNRIATINPLGIVSRTYYDSMGRPWSQITNLQGQSISSPTPPDYMVNLPDRNIRVDTIYDLTGSQIEIIEYLKKDSVILERVTRTYYDLLGRQVTIVHNFIGTITDPPPARNLNGPSDVNLRTDYTYDKTGNQSKYIDEMGVVTKYEYDDLYRLAAVIENYIETGGESSDTNVRTEYTRDIYGNILTIRNANAVYNNTNAKTIFIYDILGRMVEQQDPDLYVTQYKYDVRGLQVALIDPMLNTTYQQYDTFGRLIRIDYPGPEPDEFETNIDVAFAYNGLGWKTQMVDQVGTTTWAYDPLGRAITVTDSYSGTVAYTYNATGWITGITYPDLKQVDYIYDDLGRLKSVNDWQRTQTGYTWNTDGSAASISYPNNSTATYAYDGIGREKTITNATNYGELSAFEYGYDLVGNRTTVTETLRETGAFDLIFQDGFESGDFSRWSANSGNLSLSVQTQAALVGEYGMQVVINSNGSLYVTDQTPQAEKHYRARFYFDPNSIQMNLTDVHEIFVGYNYSMISNVPVFKIELGKTSTGYKARIGTRTDTGTWLYSPWSASFSNDVHYFEIEWKAARFLGTNDGYMRWWIDGSSKSGISTIDNDATQIDLVNLGAVTGIDTSTRGTYYFDGFESRKDTYIGNQPLNSMFNAELEAMDFVELEETTYFTSTATITSELALPEDEIFFFPEDMVILDDMDFLLDGAILVEEGNTVIQYEYDKLYRLTEANYSDGSYYHYTYDRVGNRLSRSTAQGTIYYTYDDANRMLTAGGVTYTWDDNGNLLSDGYITYTYDAANRLVGTSGSGTTATAYVYNGLGDKIEQWQDLQATRFTLDLNAPLTQVLSDGPNTYLYGAGRIGEINGQAREYYFTDALGSVRQLINSTSLTLNQSYEPYGTMLASQGSGESRYGFAGEWTEESGLVYLRARYYAPKTGRFISKDVWPGDAKRPVSYNAWLYGYGNPIIYTDPSGHDPWWCDNTPNPEICRARVLGLTDKTSLETVKKSTVYTYELSECYGQCEPSDRGPAIVCAKKSYWSIGTLILNGGKTYLYTHNHYRMLDYLSLFKIRTGPNLNNPDEEIASLDSTQFHNLNFLIDSPGNLLIDITNLPNRMTFWWKTEFNLEPATFGSANELTTGTYVTSAIERNGNIQTMDAKIINTNFPDKYKVKIFENVIVQGDSGGGLWYQGKVLGNNWYYEKISGSDGSEEFFVSKIP
jgi:RHS repeat-associated protein